MGSNPKASALAVLLAAWILTACGPGNPRKGAVAETAGTAVPEPVLAPTPPMGFNTWNKFGCNVDEKLIRETADAVVETGKTFDERFEVKVPAYGVVMVRIWPDQAGN
jgi:hypothetical protein